MILKIGDGYEIDTSFDDAGNRWAQLWAPKTLLRDAGSIMHCDGPDCINECLDEFREIMGMGEDEINEWQRETKKGGN